MVEVNHWRIIFLPYGMENLEASLPVAFFAFMDLEI